LTGGAIERRLLKMEKSYEEKSDMDDYERHAEIVAYIVKMMEDAIEYRKKLNNKRRKELQNVKRRFENKKAKLEKDINKFQKSIVNLVGKRGYYQARSLFKEEQERKKQKEKQREEKPKQQPEQPKVLNSN
jgi:uncharacterized membrane protein YgaE (UPF0421/DUF939 family)